jgi:hypothetical protein
VLGKILREDSVYFLKLASTKGIGLRLQNEVSWNKFFEISATFFYSPKVIETGFILGLPFFVCEFLEGRALLEKTERAEKLTDSTLSVIANIALEIQRNTDFESLLDVQSSWEIEKFNIQNAQKIASWYDNRVKKLFDLSMILEQAMQIQNCTEFGLNHKDFVPWHLLKTEKGYVLLDAEHSTRLYHKWYDIAYFYQRIFILNPERADAFLSIFKSKISPQEFVSFEKLFPILLAGRAIGGIWDALNDEQNDWTNHKLLLDKIVAKGATNSAPKLSPNFF